MKKIINGRKYDTDTAERLCHDYEWHHTLYRTPRGRFFSIYQLDEDTMAILSEVSEATARKTIEVWGDADLYERIFGEAEEA